MAMQNVFLCLVSMMTQQLLAESDFLQRESTRQDERGPLLAGLQAVGQDVQQQIAGSQPSSMIATSSQDVEVPKISRVIAPFGKEDTATALQSHAARTQDTLVDAVENAEVAEIKRAVFRSLTRLRAAEIKEFDTIARLETQAIDEYNDNHHYRKENPLEYLHADEPKVGADKFTSFHS